MKRLVKFMAIILALFVLFYVGGLLSNPDLMENLKKYIIILVKKFERFEKTMQFCYNYI